MIRIDEDGDGEDDFWGLDRDGNFPDVFDCAAEDVNGNRLLDPGEDINGNGELDPRDPALVDADPGNQPTVIGNQITTDTSGVGFFSLAYPQSNALYFDVEITARVEALGTEGVANFDTTLDIIANDVTNVDILPPNEISPFGVLPDSGLMVCN